MFDYRAAGRIGRRGTASGSLRVTVTLIGPDGATEATCTTPTVRWRGVS